MGLTMVAFAGTATSAPVTSCTWAEGTGSVAGDVLMPQEARQLALRQARSQAIQKAVGVAVHAETIVRDFAVVSDFIQTLTKGYVRSEQVVRWEQDRYQPRADETPIPIYRVTLKVCVLPVATLRDPGFFVTVTANKVVFTSGEKANLTIKSTRPAAIMIYNLTADDQVRPYEGAPWMGLPMKVDGVETATFPPTGVVLEMELPKGLSRTSEAFIIVATKRADHIVLPLQVGKQGTVSLSEFYAAVAAVETDIVETIVPYSIVGR